MSIDLMAKRFKVIADYPACEVQIGDMLMTGVILGKAGWYSQNGKRIHGPEFYPHLFKELAWYEEREESDMPQYIRINQVQVVKVAKHHTMRHDEFMAHDTKYNYPYAICKPATQADYEQYLNKQS